MIGNILAFLAADRRLVQLLLFSCSAMSSLCTLWSAAHQAACPSSSPWVCSNSCPLSQWCYLTISSSAASFSYCLQSPSIRVFSSESALCIRWPKYWSISFGISPSNGYSGLISFRINWFDLHIVQGTLKSLLQHHNSEASILQGSDLRIWFSPLLGKARLRVGI